MDHNFEDIDFEDPLDGSLLDVSVQEEIDEQYRCGISNASFFLKSNLKRHPKAHSCSIACEHSISHLGMHSLHNRMPNKIKCFDRSSIVTVGRCGTMSQTRIKRLAPFHTTAYYFHRQQIYLKISFAAYVASQHRIVKLETNSLDTNHNVQSSMDQCVFHFEATDVNTDDCTRQVLSLQMYHNSVRKCAFC